MRARPRFLLRAALAGAFAIGGVVVGGACGSEEGAGGKTVTVAPLTVATQEETVTQVETATKTLMETETVTKTETVTETVTKTVTAKPKPRSGRRARAAGGVRLTGNGDRALPPIRVLRGGTLLRWTNDGEVFSLFTARGILVDSVARSGSTFLARGRHRIDVVASGRWTIRIPNARRVR